MTDDRLYHDPDLVEFYDLENAGGADFAFCLDFARDTKSVLDLGCGTGALAAALAPGRRVVGIDPAASMLSVARSRAGGDAARWVEADARTVRLSESFDLVLMTGHAFQCLLTDDDVLAVLGTIKAHLSPSGIFIFDSRNPEREEWREWAPGRSERIVTHPHYGDVTAWNDVRFDSRTAIVTYDTFYRTPDGRRLHAASKIRFIAKDRLAALIDASGLKAERWLGDWQGNPYRNDADEIIPVGGSA